MGLGVVFVHEVHIVGADHPHTMFARQFAQVLVHLHLHRIGLMIGPVDRRLMKLKFQIVVVAEHLLVPADRFLGLLQVARRNGARHFAGQTGRTADQSFAVLLDLGAVGTRTHVESVGPRFRHDFRQIMIALQILGQQNKVVAALVGLSLLVLQTPPRHVDLTADDGLEIGRGLECRNFTASGLRVEIELLADSPQIVHIGFQTRIGFGILRRIVLLALQHAQRIALFGRIDPHVGHFAPHFLEQGEQFLQFLDLVVFLAVLLLDVVVEFLDSEHVAVIRHSNAGLTVGHRLVHQLRNAGLTVEYRILGMYVQMAECGHEGKI